ncbi:MAG: tRNA pseudouridine synthase A [Desulfurococcaceae archaeon]
MSLARLGMSFIDYITERAGYRNKWIVIRDADASPDEGTLPYKRKIDDHIRNGVINIDKPPGPTSHEVVAWVKRLFGLEKAGHGGTLEPLRGGETPR